MPLSNKTWAWLLLAVFSSARAIEPTLQESSRALDRARAAMIGLQTLAVEDARSASTLGSERQGSGVLIGNDGLVLTIGYLILEADEVELVVDETRHVPARVVGYDVATGLGLVQALLPLRMVPVPMGRSGGLSRDEPLVMMAAGEEGTVDTVRLLAQRPFAGFWEYQIDSALFTSPPHGDHSGAGLFNLSGELVGVGSLLVNDALGPEAGRVPANMFVPIDLLKPILRELRESGRSRASVRAWMGVNCVEADGELRIVRVADDSPADVAGLQPGDRILRIDGIEVSRLEQLWKRLWAGEGTERAVRLDIERDGEAQSLTVQTVDRAKTLRRAQGI
jgi:S1-C subfamily serine protease